MQKPDDRKNAYESVQNYNAFVMGVHNYYCIATNASQDFAEIAFPIIRSLKTRLKRKYLKQRDMQQFNKETLW